MTIKFLLLNRVFRCGVPRVANLCASLSNHIVTAVDTREVYDCIISNLLNSSIANEVGKFADISGKLNVLSDSESTQILIYGVADSNLQLSSQIYDDNNVYFRHKYCLNAVRKLYPKSSVFSAATFSSLYNESMDTHIKRSTDISSLPEGLLRKLSNLQLFICDYWQVTDINTTQQMISNCFKFLNRLVKQDIITRDTLVIMPHVQFECESLRVKFYKTISKTFSACVCPCIVNPWYQVNEEFLQYANSIGSEWQSNYNKTQLDYLNQQKDGVNDTFLMFRLL